MGRTHSFTYSLHSFPSLHLFTCPLITLHTDPNQQSNQVTVWSFRERMLTSTPKAGTKPPQKLPRLPSTPNGNVTVSSSKKRRRSSIYPTKKVCVQSSLAVGV